MWHRCKELLSVRDFGLRIVFFSIPKTCAVSLSQCSLKRTNSSYRANMLQMWKCKQLIWLFNNRVSRRRRPWCHDNWPLSLSQEAPTACWICVLCELEPLSNHEEQLSCSASWCAHCSAAVSGLLRHQMAVSTLSQAFPHLYAALQRLTFYHRRRKDDTEYLSCG